MPHMQPSDESAVALRPPTGGLRAKGSALWQSLLGLAASQLKLASLELRLAGEQLISLIAIGVLLAMLLLSAWLLVLALIVMGLLQAGLSLSLALLIAAFLDLLAAAGLYGLLRWRGRQADFAASIRRLGALPVVRT
jgi:uncharacterized membrane protein YqjE